MDIFGDRLHLASAEAHERELRKARQEGVDMGKTDLLSELFSPEGDSMLTVLTKMRDMAEWARQDGDEKGAERFEYLLHTMVGQCQRTGIFFIGLEGEDRYVDFDPSRHITLPNYQIGKGDRGVVIRPGIRFHGNLVYEPVVVKLEEKRKS